MHAPRRAELLLALASTLFCVIALEGAIRAGLVPLPGHVLSDGWWRERWLRREARGQRVAKPIDRFDPLLGWTLREGLDGVRQGHVTTHSNAAGMRGRRDYALAPGPGLRIVLLGDSFTFGQCVEDDETYAALLERRIAPGEVLNLAVHGHAHDQQLLRLRREGLAYRPDLILLGFLDADVGRNQLRFRDYAKPRFSLEDGALALENVPVPEPERYARAFRLRALDYAEMLWDALFAGRLERENEERTEAILQALAADARRAGARLAFVFLPSKRQALRGVASPDPAYTKLCAGGEVLCIDPTPRIHAFLEGESDPASHFACHYSPAIHRRIAEEIATALDAAGVRAPAR